VKPLCLLLCLLLVGCRESVPGSTPPTKEQLLRNAQECTEMIAELRSLSDEPSRETLRQIEQIEVQRDEYLRLAN